MEATGMVLLPGWFIERRRNRGATGLKDRHPRRGASRRGEGTFAGRSLATGRRKGGFQLRRERRAHLHGRSCDRVSEGEPGRVEELALEPELSGPSIHRV